MNRLIRIADELIIFCHVGTPREVVLGAVAVAYITGDPGAGERLLEGHYSGAEADVVWALLEVAASLGKIAKGET